MMRWRKIHVESHAEALQLAGLDSIDAFRNVTGHFIKNHHGLRDVVRLSLQTGETKTSFYLKRILVPYRRYLLHGVPRHWRLTSTSGLEWRNMRSYARAGVKTCKPVAYGAEFGPTGEAFSFILTEAARGRPLDELLTTVTDRGVRRRVSDGVAHMVSRAHHRRVGMPGLLGRHVFIDLDGSQNVRRVSLIDLDRISTPLLMRKRIARDLAQLHLSLPRRMVSRTERLRFLRAYDPKAGRSLLRRVEKMMAHLRRRRPNLSREFLAASAATNLSPTPQPLRKLPSSADRPKLDLPLPS